MYQIFGTIILILGGASYWLWTDNQTLKENQVKLEYAIEEQKAAFETMKESYEKQGQALNNLQSMGKIKKVGIKRGVYAIVE